MRHFFLIKKQLSTFWHVPDPLFFLLSVELEWYPDKQDMRGVTLMLYENLTEAEMLHHLLKGKSDTASAAAAYNIISVGFPVSDHGGQLFAFNTHKV